MNFGRRIIMNRRFKFTLTYMVDDDTKKVIWHSSSLKAFVKSFDHFQRSNIDFFIDNLLEIKQELEEVW